jgi:hypothetical protein
MNILNQNKISGAIGLSILRKAGKEYYIFYDQHNNKNYCETNNSKFLDDILEENFLNSETLILLEELVNFGPTTNIITIWKDTLHTTNFKKFFMKHNDNPNIVPFDIRTILFPVSPFLIINYNNPIFKKEFPEVNIEDLESLVKSVTVYDYFYCFFYFFDIVPKNTSLHQTYKPIIYHIKKIKKIIINCFKKLNFKNEIYTHFKKLKALVQLFKLKFVDKNPNMILEEFIKKYGNEFRDEKIMSKNLITTNLNEINNYTWVNFIEILSDYTIEFYAILLIFCFNKKNTFIHSGLAHSSNIVNLLRYHYKFESVKDTGITKYSETEDNYVIKNCIGL